MNKKPLGRKSYGSIPHLSCSTLGKGDHHIHIGQENILTKKLRDKFDRVIVTEKYDGSNVAVAKINGKIFALTRSGYEAKTSPYKQHHEFDNWVNKNKSLFKKILRDGQRLCGEWLMQAHGIKYRIKGDPIVFFDIFTGTENERGSFDYLVYTTYGELRTPRRLHDSTFRCKPVHELMKRLNKGSKNISTLSEKPEGMVFRCERNGQFDFIAKWVRPDFKAGQYIINIPDEHRILNEVSS